MFERPQPQEQTQPNQSGHAIEKFQHLETVAEKPLREHPAENRHEIVADTFYFFRDLLRQEGFEEYTDPGKAYAKLPAITYIVRREDPRRIFKLFSGDGSYEIGFEGDRYANCAEWEPGEYSDKGLDNAYLEGFTNMNSIVTLIGFVPDDDTDVIAMDDSIQNFYGLDRTKVRSFRGTVSRDKVAFINLRIPGHLFPESEMTDSELDTVEAYKEALENGEKTNPVMIHRTYKSVK